jgi:hypothetical protein
LQVIIRNSPPPDAGQGKQGGWPKVHLQETIKFDSVPGSVYRKDLISYLMRKNEEIRGKRLGRLKRSTGNAIPNTRSEWSYS